MRQVQPDKESLVTALYFEKTSLLSTNIIIINNINILIATVC